MRKGELIPSTLSGFDIYIRKAVPYILFEETPTHPRGERLGMTVQEMSDSSDYLKKWYTGDPLDRGAYELHTNDNTKTKATRKTVVKIMDEFTPFFGNILRRMATLTYTQADRETLNIPERDDTNTSRGKIEDIPLGNAKPNGGNIMEIRVRIGQDASRASMHPLADAIEMRYFIGDNPPALAADMPEQKISKSALFDFKTPDGSAGKKFTAYVRYINLSTPENNSPWSNIMQANIS